MTPAYIEALAKALAPVIKTVVAAEVGVARREVEEIRQECDGLRKQLAEITAPVNGKDADMDALRAFIAEQVKALPTPKDGTSVTLGDVAPMILEEVRAEAAKHLQAIPVPKDGEPGKSITAEDIAPVLELNVAKWALEFERRGNDAVQRVLDKIVQPKDGRDGLGFDDLAVEYDGEKTITLKMQRGDVVKEANIVLPINIDRGIFKEGQSYTAGDSVTWGGSYWIAQRDTGAKPDSADSGWRLAVKKGRDGKDGRNGIDKTAPVVLKD